MIFCSNYTIVNGKGKSEDALVAFDKALISAGIEKFNLVPVSSILPYNCEYQPLEKLQELQWGTIIHVVLAKIITKKPVQISAGICLVKEENSRRTFMVEYEGEVDKKTCRQVLEKRAKLIAKARDIDIENLDFHITSGKGDKSKYTCLITAVCLW